MGFYDDVLLPWGIRRHLGRKEILQQRREALATARGDVLEVGFGFGGSIGAYPAGPEGVRRLVALDPKESMTRHARERAAAAPFPIEIVNAPAEKIPCGDASFDTVVSMWTLCTLPDHAAAFREIRRVLRPGGRYLFLEHGRADEPRLARWQDRLTPLSRRLGGGCRLNLDIAALVRGGGFEFERLDRYVARPGCRIGSQMYRGTAVPQ